MTNDELNDQINHIRRLSDFVILLEAQNEILRAQVERLRAKAGEKENESK